MFHIFKFHFRILIELYFQNHQKITPFKILGDELRCDFFRRNLRKSHLNSSPKIGQNITFFPSSFQKITPQFGAFGTPLCTPESRFVAFGTRFWTPGSHFFVHSGFLDSISDLLDSILGLGGVNFINFRTWGYNLGLRESTFS